MSSIESIQKNAQQAIAKAKDLAELEQLRVQFLGKKGEITSQLKSLGSLPAEERKTVGQEINRVKQSVQQDLELRRQTLEQERLEQELKQNAVDITLPGKGG